jgi:hypothetical protein
MVQTIAKCIICDAVLRHSLAKYCRRCGNIMERVEPRGKADIAARVKALKDSWDQESECFRCHYSGIQLVDDKPKDPRYITFDHLSPRKEGEQVITASLIKDMKSDMSVEEFKIIINQLAKHFEDGTPVDETIFKVKHYQR